MFKLRNIETLTGPEAVERIEAKAKADLPDASTEVSEALEDLMELIKSPDATKAKVEKYAEEFHAANERLAAVYNVVSFFVLLDDQSHYGSAERAR